MSKLSRKRREELHAQAVIRAEHNAARKRHDEEYRAFWRPIFERMIGLSAQDAPSTWIDHLGRARKTSRSRRRLDSGSVKTELTAFVLFRDGTACKACGVDDGRPQIDHILALCKGGSHHPDNLQVLCGMCNSRKAGFVDAKRTL